jgi:CSLREA domain-containing protein
MYPSLRQVKPLVMLMFLLLTMTSSTLTVTPVSATRAIIVVNSDQDVVDDDGLCTLREAIHNSNFDTRLFSGSNECAAGTFGPDTIRFHENYTITLDPSLGQLDISGETNIIGKGAENTIIQASECNPVDENETCTHRYRVFKVIASGRLTLDGVTVRHGYMADPVTIIGEDNEGGGIYIDQGIVFINNSVVTANRAKHAGGGIYNFGSLIITNSLLKDNQADYVGGAIFHYTYHVEITNSSLLNNKAQNGGGMATRRGSVIVTGSTFIDNTAGRGGGILNSEATATITNSTFSGNKALTSVGGAIYNDRYGTSILNLKNTTISDSSALRGSGIYLVYESILNYANTIIANASSGSDCAYERDVTIVNTHNLVEDGSCGGTPGDPKLGPLADNGGPTLTHALLKGSPAIDAGDPATCAAEPVNNFDQRGIARPQGAGCDIGAYEYEPKWFFIFPLIFR